MSPTTPAVKDRWRWRKDRLIHSSWSFLLSLSVLVFHMPMVMLSLPKIVDDTPVACLTPLSWCMTESVSLITPGSDQSGMVWLLVSQGQSTIWQSPSLSRSNTWLLSSSLNPSTHLVLVFEVWRYLLSDAVLTPAVLPETGRLVEGGSILFLPVQVQRTSPRPKFSILSPKEWPLKLT